jgi:hypothetical protein
MSTQKASYVLASFSHFRKLILLSHAHPSYIVTHRPARSLSHLLVDGEGSPPMAPTADSNQSPPQHAQSGPASPQNQRLSPSSEYDSGFIKCDCGASIPIRDEKTNQFTARHWDAHKQSW